LSSQLVEREPLFPKLKPGPGLSAETVLADQRRRLHGAIVGMVVEGGWRKVRVREVIRTAGVSSASFYRHFANADECFASALDAAVGDLLNGLSPSLRSGREWRESLRVTVNELMTRFSSDQAAARVALIDSFAAGPNARRRVGTTVIRLEEVLNACFSSSLDGAPAPRHLVAGMTGGVLRVLRRTVASGRARELPGLTEPLVDWLLSLSDPKVVGLPPGDARNNPGISPSSLLSLLHGDPGDDRRRLLQTVMRLVAESGFSEVTAPLVRRDAGVAKRQFDSYYVGVEECFLDGVDALVESVATEANRPAAGDWTRRSHRSIAAMCSSAADNRALARVTFLEIFAPGQEGLQRREEIIGSAATALQRTIPPEERPSGLIAEASVAAAWHVAQADVFAGRTRNLANVAPLLSYLVMAPIVGAGPAVSAIRAEALESNSLKA
jgi:AcrR family transcriptional regulator